jgi:hypothetical protein
MHSVSLYLSASVFYPELPGGLRQFYNYAPGEKGTRNPDESSYAVAVWIPLDRDPESDPHHS